LRNKKKEVEEKTRQYEKEKVKNLEKGGVKTYSAVCRKTSILIFGVNLQQGRKKAVLKKGSTQKKRNPQDHC